MRFAQCNRKRVRVPVRGRPAPGRRRSVTIRVRLVTDRWVPSSWHAGGRGGAAAESRPLAAQRSLLPGYGSPAAGFCSRAAGVGGVVGVDDADGPVDGVVVDGVTGGVTGVDRPYPSCFP